MKRIVLMFCFFGLIGCSPSYKPLYPPYAISPLPSEGSFKEPSTELQGTLPGARITEKTLEDSSQPALVSPKSEKKPLTKEKPSEVSRQVPSSKMVESARKLRQEGKIDEAIKSLERAIELNPNNGDAFYELSLCWKEKRNFNKALFFADKAEKLFSGNRQKLKDLYILKAQLLEALGKKEEAKAYREKAK